MLEFVAAGDEHAEPVAAAAGQDPERGEGGEHHLPLLPAGRAEVEARGAVDDDEGVQLAVGLGGAHVRLERAGGETPVDAARIVAGFVTSSAGTLGSGADGGRDVVTGQSAVEPPAHLELEPAQGGGLRQQVGACRRWSRGGAHPAAGSSKSVTVSLAAMSFECTVSAKP